MRLSAPQLRYLVVQRQGKKVRDPCDIGALILGAGFWLVYILVQLSSTTLGKALVVGPQDPKGPGFKSPGHDGSLTL